MFKHFNIEKLITNIYSNDEEIALRYNINKLKDTHGISEPFVCISLDLDANT